MNYNKTPLYFMNFIIKRFKSKGKKSLTIPSTKRALDYFDITYASVYGPKWPSIRLGLLSKKKYVALVNNFANYEEIINKFQKLGATDIRDKYNFYANRVIKRNEINKETKSNLIEEKEGEEMSTTRPFYIELDDDEKAFRAKLQPSGHYPEEYRQRALARGLAQGDLELDPSNRVILPSQAGFGSGVMQDYVPSTKLKGLESWLEETDIFLESNKGDNDIGLKVIKENKPLVLPEMLKIYSFNKGDITDFPQPEHDRNLNVSSHFLLDGASLMPVIALDIQPGNRILDLCAAPGGKSLLALQTMLPGLLVCNDISESRVKRINNLMKQYIPKGFSSIEDKVAIFQRDGLKIPERDVYDRILVDAPCLADRHVLHDDDNSIFKPSRVKERLMMPELQCGLLFSALQCLKPGGSLVYSTCTLSPLQNDGVVHMALSKIWQETPIECSVVDLSNSVGSLGFLYRMGSNLGLRYGQIILPFLLSNFGPMYFSKITRTK